MNSNLDAEYWIRFWLDYSAGATEKDEQSQVLRTRNGAPIDPQKWAHTLTVVARHLELSPDDRLLDLCCGNGLFAAAFARKVKAVEAMDLSPQLIDRLMRRHLPNVRGHVGDVRDAAFEPGSFSKVLWYAGIQYLGEPDIVLMIRKIKHWMRPGGILLIGDVPDRAKLWQYFNSQAREETYFDSIARKQPIIGSWLEDRWLEKLCMSAGFAEATARPQDPALIYADFRFDLVARA